MNPDIIFVLGVGSSLPYGLPSSETLNDEIEKILETIIRESRGGHHYVKQNNYISQFAEVLKSIYPIEKKRGLYEDFYNQFTHDYFQTIDEFLLGKKGEILELGKTLIASVILYYEREDLLTSRKNMTGWYGAFWKQIKESLVERKLDWLNKILFLTFNYDRSLEQFLYHNLQSLVDNPIEILSKFRIEHVYGPAGGFPNLMSRPGMKPVHYGLNLEMKEYAVEKVIEARKWIRHPKEFNSMSDHVKELLNLDNKFYELIRFAKSIYFLGCGYHIDNLRTLDIQNAGRETMTLLAPLIKPDIRGTKYKLEAYKEKRVNKNFPNIELHDEDCVSFYHSTISEKIEELIDTTTSESKFPATKDLKSFA